MSVMKKLILIILFMGVGLNAADVEGTVSEKEGLKIREKAGASHKQIGFIPFQERLLILDENGPKETLYGIRSSWMKIKYKNITGWAFGGFIDKGGKWETGKIEYAAGVRKRDMNFDYIGKTLHIGIDCDGSTYSGYSLSLILSAGNKASSNSISEGGPDGKRPGCGYALDTTSLTGIYKVSNGKLEIHFDKIVTLKEFSYYEGMDMKKEVWNKKCKPYKEESKISEREVLIPYECKRREDGTVSNGFLREGDRYFYTFRK